MMPDIVIAPTDPEHASALRMLADGNRFYEQNYPPESNHLFDVADLKQPNVTFYMAHAGVDAVGIAALVALKQYGEIKRMWVEKTARGLGVGTSLMTHIEARARTLDLDLLRLETGVGQLDAIAFYRRLGFAETSAYGDYAPDPLSVFMEKRLA